MRFPILDYLQTLTVPTPFPVGPVNCYLADGDELTLIDTGPNDAPTVAALREQLAGRGFAFKDIRRVVITHAHADHFGLAAQIVAESGARVLSHSRNREWLTDWEHEMMRRHDFYLDVFVRNGAPREYGDMVIKGMRHLSRYAASVPADHFAPLEDGDVITLGSTEWHVVFAPGHASGLICLYEQQSHTLISSDHLLPDITSNPVMEPPARGENERPHALANYLASMERTVQLDARIALPAHGDPIRDIRTVVDARRVFHRQRLDYIEQQLKQGSTTAYELCHILFPKLKSVDVFLGLSEVIGHLDILEIEGRVQREERDGLVRYAPTRQHPQ